MASPTMTILPRPTMKATALWLLFLLPFVQGLPRGFVLENVRPQTEALVAGVFAPNPRREDHRPMLLMASRGGSVRILENPENRHDDPGTNLEDTISGDQDQNLVLDLGTISSTSNQKLCRNGDRGLLSMAVHPDFLETRWVYLYYTNWRDGCLEDPERGPQNVLARYTMNPTSLRLEQEEILAEFGFLATTSRNGGALGFGTDGLLYLATGDGGVPASAPNQQNLKGKLLRLHDDGRVPEANPHSALGIPCGKFNGTVPAIFIDDAMLPVYCSEIVSWGLRDPVRMDIPLGDATTTEFSVFDAGDGRFDELNSAGTKYIEKDYGWPDREGPCTTDTTIEDCRPPPPGSNLIDPFHYYSHSTTITQQQDAAAAGSVAVVPGGIWPDKYKRLLLNADRRTIHALLENPDAECRESCSPPTPGFTNTTFYDTSKDSASSRMFDMFFGPYKETKALYVIQNDSTGNNSILRIRHIGLPPVAIIDVNGNQQHGTEESTKGSLPTSSTNLNDAVMVIDPTSPPPMQTSFLVGDSVQFDGSGSFSPGGDELFFQWDFGDKTDSTTNSTHPSHVYDAPGNYTVILVVSNTRNQAQLASTTVVVGTSPAATMLSPREGDFFSIGESLRLEAEAYDYEGNPIPDDKMVWDVRRYHPDGFDYVLEGTAGNGLEVDPLPEALARSAKTYFLRVTLFVADDQRLSTRVVTDVYPDTVAIELITHPVGLAIAAGNEEFRAPAQIQTWVDDVFPVQVIREQPPYRFQYWSDGNTDANRTIFMPPYRFRQPTNNSSTNSPPEASSRIATRPNRTILTLEAIFCLIDNESCRGADYGSCCSGFCDDDGFCRHAIGDALANAVPILPHETDVNSRPIPAGREEHDRKPDMVTAKGDIEPERKPIIVNKTDFIEDYYNNTVEDSQDATTKSETSGMLPSGKWLIGVSMGALLLALLYVGWKYSRLKFRMKNESRDSPPPKDSRERDTPPQSIQYAAHSLKKEESTSSNVVDSTDDTKRSFSSSNASFHSAVSISNASRFSGSASIANSDASSFKRSAPIWEKLAAETERRARLRAKLQHTSPETTSTMPDTPETTAESSSIAGEITSEALAGLPNQAYVTPEKAGLGEKADSEDDDSYESVLSPTSLLTTNINETLVRMDDLLSKISARKQARQSRKEALIKAASAYSSTAAALEKEVNRSAATENESAPPVEDDAASEGSDDHAGSNKMAPIWLQKTGSDLRDVSSKEDGFIARSFSMSSMLTTSESSADDPNNESRNSTNRWLSELPNTSAQSFLVFQDNDLSGSYRGTSINLDESDQSHRSRKFIDDGESMASKSKKRDDAESVSHQSRRVLGGGESVRSRNRMLNDGGSVSHRSRRIPNGGESVGSKSRILDEGGSISHRLRRMLEDEKSVGSRSWILDDAESISLKSRILDGGESLGSKGKGLGDGGSVSHRSRRVLDGGESVGSRRSFFDGMSDDIRSDRMESGLGSFKQEGLDDSGVLFTVDIDRDIESARGFLHGTD